MSGSPPVRVDQAVATWAVRAVQAAGLMLVIVTVTVDRVGLWMQGRGVAIAAALAASAAGWITWMLAGHRRPLALPGLVVMAVAGGALAGLSPAGPALLVGCLAALNAGISLPVVMSASVIAGGMASLAVAVLATGVPAKFWWVLVGYAFASAGTWAFGLNRRAHLARAERAELMLAEVRRAREAEARAATLAERARIAREIHDVLAHSLSAVSVNLQAAEGLLGARSEHAGEPDVARALDCITRAGGLARQGLAAARRAVLALREDQTPLPELLASLAAQHRADGDADVDLAVTGEVRPVAAGAALAAYRTAQEALTNARKHGPANPSRCASPTNPTVSSSPLSIPCRTTPRKRRSPRPARAAA